MAAEAEKAAHPKLKAYQEEHHHHHVDDGSTETGREESP
jgi:hypothetical protein